mmetsp:Transcript_48850/g.98300  ORF Transcript_48850/g.98300 Transcript_48850/m.98300 type:complete len:182 (-) Transcript_48850:129-674(-)
MRIASRMLAGLALCIYAEALMLKLPSQRRLLTRTRSSSTEDEIADLEKRLADLKRVATEAEPVESAVDVLEVEPSYTASPTTEQPAAKINFDPSTLSARQKVANIKNMPASSGLVTESWKESDSEGGDNGVLPIIGGILAVLILAVFSQIPIGNDISVGLPANEMRRASPEEIKARFEGVQ